MNTKKQGLRRKFEVFFLPKLDKDQKKKKKRSSPETEVVFR